MVTVLSSNVYNSGLQPEGLASTDRTKRVEQIYLNVLPDHSFYNHHTVMFRRLLNSLAQYSSATHEGFLINYLQKLRERNRYPILSIFHLT